MPETITLYHNPRCSKSRAALAFLAEHNVRANVVDYLHNPPDADTIRQLIKQLGFSSARDMMRTKEDLYVELDLAHADEDALIAAMTAHPILIERPIAVLGHRAAIGRPLSNIESLLTAD